MKRTSLIRLGGLAAIAGGMLFIAFPLVVTVDVVALLLVSLGMVGFHALQRHSYGTTGRAGFWLVVVGSLVLALGGVVSLFTWDLLQEVPPSYVTEWGQVGSVVATISFALEYVSLVVGLVSLLAGMEIYGAATMEAKVLPRWCGMALFATLPVTLVAGVLLAPFGYGYLAMSIVFGLAWLAFGYVLWRRMGVAKEQPSKVQ